MLIFRRIWKSRGIWLRALLCWLIALSFYIFESSANFDWRFRLRGDQTRTEKIVIVYFDQEDATDWYGPSRNILRSLKEFSTLTDSFFWNSLTWRRLLWQILEQNPQ